MTNHRRVQIDMRFDEVDIDNFCGAGNASDAIEDVTGSPVWAAINHDAHSIEIHTLNHQQTRHYKEDVFSVDPHEVVGGRRVRVAWFSPDCTHHSRCKGGKPVDNKMRGLAWVARDWARAVRPRIIGLENVPEFEFWGPLVDSPRGPVPDPQRKGETFAEFVAELRALGYAVEWRTLVACDYGTPQRRTRFFLIARSDGHPIVWPEPTHGPGLLPYRTAADIMDWTIPLPSIFGRKKPHVEATQRRIAAGVRKFVLGAGRPFIVQMGYGERPGQAPRAMSIDEPLGTVVAGGIKHAVCAVFVAKHFGGPNGHSTPGSSLRAPLGTVTCRDHHSLVAASLSRGSQHRAHVAAWFAEHGLGAPVLTLHGERFSVIDIGMRKLVPRELARAQDFREDYIFTGSDTNQVRRIGNAVPKRPVRALVAAQLGTEIARAA